MFSKSTGYALQALVYLSQVRGKTPERHVQSAELAEATTIPSSFLSKILQQLAADSLIESVRGRGGGVRLLMEPDEITLHRVAACM
ncbi:Rrf2 family transcriptional regulator, partial [bacterium]|nr:Rrf2 family transcriptional regulator [bacterium]